ncbi:hypothetical protein A2U01_0037599 [Trifolium medium]|uniref:Uncharacterized protein n=1 Tax=Trifolium medium TaxID=97028 RepID=A0A392PXP9_9FABA|nr:hypothetical protein [Trifolium medium]
MDDEIARLEEVKMKIEKEIEIERLENERLKKELVALQEKKWCARRKSLEELEQSLHAEFEKTKVLIHQDLEVSFERMQDNLLKIIGN